MTEKGNLNHIRVTYVIKFLSVIINKILLIIE